MTTLDAQISSWMSQPVTPRETLAKSPASMRTRMECLIMRIQAEICRGFEELEGPTGKKFQVDKWQRKEGGGGVTCVMQGGRVFEKAGINVSVVTGALDATAINAMKSESKLQDHDTANFFAAGISSVNHPVNPHVPTMHFNYRFFEIQSADGKTDWWFGGGVDLTPYYLVEEDARSFHQTQKTACDKHSSQYYPKFKKWCDEYFTIKHRGETRGVGGIFFDDLNDRNQDEIFAFVTTAAEAVLPSYKPIVKKRMDDPYTDEQIEWQQIRRGRYTEFNLVYDRGTKFGLATPGSRIESILMSLPLTARWEYCHEPKDGTEEAKIMKVFRNPREWL